MVNELAAGRLAQPSGVRWRGALARARALLSAAHWADLGGVLVLGVLPVVMLLTLDDYGLTYDEEPHLKLGERVLAFYSGGFHASSSLSRSAYGAGFDLLAALLRRVSPWDEYRTNHILCIFVAQLGWLGTWKLGRLAGGPGAGLAALIFLVLAPVYYGHTFNNPKDIPFAVGYVWGLYVIARVLVACVSASRSVALGKRFWLGASVALGLAMSVRVGGAILIAYLALLLALIGLDRLRLGGAAALRPLTGVFWRAALAAVAGWAFMLPFWPRALFKPVEGPAAALETVTRYTAYDSPTLLGGKLIPSQSVPWSYLPTYFAVQLPELTSLCFLASAVALGVCTIVCWRRRRPLPWVPWLLVVAVLVPPGYAMLRGSTLYNGLRHFLFIIPPIAVLAGLGVASLSSWLWGRRRVLVLPLFAVLGVLAADPARALVRLHPHQHVYFNRASGGLASAVRNYETEYYGSVYRELHEQLVREVWRERRSDYLNTTFQVSGCGSKLFFTRNLPLNFQYQSMRNARHADYYATYVRDRCLNNFRDRLLVTQVEREGAQLGVARELARKRPRSASRAGGEAP